MIPDDTIAAIASAPGGAWRGILRVSGPETATCLGTCFRSDDGRGLTSVRRPTVLGGHLRLDRLDREMPADLYFWPSRRSYTREPLAEIHTLGAPALLSAALDTVCRARARLAEPGEFTMRAFLAGRLDLTQAEAVLGVIDAFDQRQLDVALRQLAGGLAGPLGRLRDELLELLAHLEAGLDFADDDIEFIREQELLDRLDHGARVVSDLTEQMTGRGSEPSESRVVLMGRPNVGKSSLLNALVGDQTALVARSPGTTRDYVTHRIDADELRCMVIDTAGVQGGEVQDAVDAAAQRVTAEQGNQAHIQVFCLDAARCADDWEREQVQRCAGRETCICVLTKCDLVPDPGLVGPLPANAIFTSSKTRQGVDRLRQEIRARIEAAVRPETDVVTGTADRCRDSLRLAEQCLCNAGEIAAQSMGEELVAAELRTALTELGRVVGAVYTDDVLDRIFSRFCIGK
jgi:tRNA modification GTPase